MDTYPEHLEVTVSIVGHNQRNDIERLLPSVLLAAQSLLSEILIVDNRSNDGTCEFVRQHFPEIEITYNPNIAGYGENHNMNLRKAKGRYFVIMNADMIVEPDIFATLRDFMDQHPDIGVASPKILNPDRTIQGLNKRYPTLLDLFLRGFLPKPFQPLFQQRMDYYEMRDVGYDYNYDDSFLSGSFLFCKTDLLKSLGGFDESFFLYFEDVDLCRRVQRTHRTAYCHETSVIHFWRRSSHKSLKWKKVFLKSAVRYFARWGYKIW